MLRKVRSSDISAIAAVYGRHVAEAGYGPIADIGAVVTASVMRQPLVLPYDALGNAECPRFDIDFCVAESAHGELVGFYICKTWATGNQHSAWPLGVETELWYVAVAPHLQGLGIGLRLVREALLINRSRTRGRGGALGSFARWQSPYAPHPAVAGVYRGRRTWRRRPSVARSRHRGRG